MKLKYYLPILAVTGLLTISCSSPVHVQKDDSVNLSDYKTYMWVDTRASETDNSARAAAYADIAVRNSVNAELRKKGWQEVTESPDVLLSYDVLVERSVEQKSDPVYTQPFSRMYYNPYTKRWSTIHYPSQFLGYQNYEVPVKEGTIRADGNFCPSPTTITCSITSDSFSLFSITCGDMYLPPEVLNISFLRSVILR